MKIRFHPKIWGSEAGRSHIFYHDLPWWVGRERGTR